ncbi:hypothetical protein BVRB_1g022410 [Beta vulgaris subsp. vulgaris]|nr:hypothetical protein BVRB_1g022410 [Beta vulgaris subsp. vulgaris]
MLETIEKRRQVIPDKHHPPELSSHIFVGEETID